MSYLDDPAKKDEAIAMGALMAEPHRLPEFAWLDPRELTMPEARMALHFAREYHRRAARRYGAVRYAPPEAVERMAAAVARKSKDPDKKRRNEAAVEALKSLIDETRSWPKPDEHEFTDILDRIRYRITDARARSGVLDIVDEIRMGRMDDLEAKLRSLAARVSPKSSLFRIARLDRCAHQSLVLAARAKADPGAARILTGFPKLNQVTGGGRRGRMWLVAAYTKDGKSQLSKEFVYEAMTKQGLGCLFLTNEQTEDDVRTMMVIRHSHAFLPGGIDYQRFIDGTMTPAEEAAHKAAVDDLESGKYGPMSYVQTPGGTTTTEIRALVEQIGREHPVDVLVVDHTMLFEPARPQAGPVAKLTCVIQELKQIALDYQRGKGLWLIAPHQISRDGYEAASARQYYLPCDLGGASEAERSADAIVWLWRDDELRDNREMRIGVCINRWGPIEPKGWDILEHLSSAAFFPIEEAAP